MIAEDEEVAHPEPTAPVMDEVFAEDASAAGSEPAEEEVLAGEELPKTGLMCCGLGFGA